LVNTLGINPDEELFIRRNGYDELIRKLKRVYSRTADRDTFSDRILTLDKVFTESLNSEALAHVIDLVDPKEKFGEDGKPLGSLKLLRGVALESLVYRECERSDVETKRLLVTVKECLIALKENHHIESALFERVEREVSQLDQQFKVIFVMRMIRTHGGAHTHGPKAIDTDLRSAGFDTSKLDLRSIFREILSRMSSLLRVLEGIWIAIKSRP
jgi:hypothetical protein